MKKIIFKSEILPAEITVKDAVGNEVKQSVSKALKFVLAEIVSAAPYNLEHSRKWTNIGNKIDSSEEEVILEDSDWSLLKDLVASGAPKAYPTMGTRIFPDEINRILEEAETVSPDASQG